MSKVYKTIITVTVLSEDVPVEIDSLEGLAREMDYGDIIGTYEVESHTLVPEEDVEKELLAIGNDGTFFGSIDEEEETE